MSFQIRIHAHVPYFDHMEFLEFEDLFEKTQNHIKAMNQPQSKNIADGSRF